LPMSAVNGAGGFVGPGSKVDILVGLRLGATLKTFPLLVDMHVVAVNQALAYDNSKPNFADMSMISLAVNQEEALLLTLATERGCRLTLLLRRDDKPKDTDYDIKAIRKMLEDEKFPVVSKTTESKGNDGVITDVPPTV